MLSTRWLVAQLKLLGSFRCCLVLQECIGSYHVFFHHCLQRCWRWCWSIATVSCLLLQMLVLHHVSEKGRIRLMTLLDFAQGSTHSYWPLPPEIWMVLPAWVVCIWKWIVSLLSSHITCRSNLLGAILPRNVFFSYSVTLVLHTIFKNNMKQFYS